MTKCGLCGTETDQPFHTCSVIPPASESSAPTDKELTIIRGMVSALAAYMEATPRLVVEPLIGILWTEEEAGEILKQNTKESGT